MAGRKLDAYLKADKKTRGRLNLDDVKANFTDYNFIISLKGVTIDTSEYKQCFYSESDQIVGFAQSGTKIFGLTDSDRTLASSRVADGEKAIIIFDHSVEEIKVKSKRNFLFNQLEAK